MYAEVKLRPRRGVASLEAAGLLLGMALLLGSQALAQPSTSRRLEALENQEQRVKAAEAAKWRTFPDLRPRPLPNLSKESYEKWHRDAISPNISESGIRIPLDPVEFVRNHVAQDAVLSCRYYWAGWKLSPGTGIRTTERECKSSDNCILPGMSGSIAVHCDKLKIRSKSFYPTGWGAWERPRSLADREVVVALCDHLKQSK